MSTKRQITEYLDIDLESEMWCCNRCGKDLISARENYKKGCLLYDRDPRDIHPPMVDTEEANFSPNPKWVRYVEYYCPGCGSMINVEAMPPGHPIIPDIQLDVEKLKEKYLQGRGK